jgi:hypothetical protein
MGRRRMQSPEEIVAKLRQVEVLLAQGRQVSEAVRAIAVSEATYFRWRAGFGGLQFPGSARSAPGLHPWLAAVRRRASARAPAWSSKTRYARRAF